METRKGLPLMEMKEEQKPVAMKLLRAAVSQLGYDKATKIMGWRACCGSSRDRPVMSDVTQRNTTSRFLVMLGPIRIGAEHRGASPFAELCHAGQQDP